MSQRDKIVLIAVVLLAVVGGGWMEVVSPEREKASKLQAQVTAAQATLSGAEGKLNEARGDQAQYAAAYTGIVSLGKAVPAAEEVPSLIYQLEHASDSKSVDFTSIVAGGSGPSSSTPSSSSTSSTSATAAGAGFTSMPFTFEFNGSYFDLEHLFESLDSFTVRTTSGSLQVSGRLLTINSVKLVPSGTTDEVSNGPPKLTGTITATAYVLPASQGLTAGATATGPAGTTSTTSSSGSTPAATAAVVTP